MTKNETKNQAKEALAPITISFGDVIVSKDPDQKLVIVDIGKGKWCAGSAIMEIDGKEAILVGRQGDSDVYKIGDKLFLVKDQTTNAVEVKESKLKDGNTVYYDAETLSLLEVVTPPSPQSKTHRVTQGETLAGIAQKYGKNIT